MCQPSLSHVRAGYRTNFSPGWYVIWFHIGVMTSLFCASFLLQVGNGSLRSISTLEKLEELAMVGCSCIDDDGLELLSKGSDSLQVITLLMLNFYRLWCIFFLSIWVVLVISFLAVGLILIWKLWIWILFAALLAINAFNADFWSFWYTDPS